MSEPHEYHEEYDFAALAEIEQLERFVGVLNLLLSMATAMGDWRAVIELRSIRRPYACRWAALEFERTHREPKTDQARSEHKRELDSLLRAVANAGCVPLHEIDDIRLPPNETSWQDDGLEELWTLEAAEPDKAA